MTYTINNWYTNSESKQEIIVDSTNNVIPSSLRQVHKYILQHPSERKQIEDAYYYFNQTWENRDWIPKNNWWMSFVVKWIDTRKKFIESIKKNCKKLWLEYELVMASVLWEQVRIANKGARWKLKDIVIGTTPKLLRSYDVSFWIWGIKLTTAYKIKNDAIKYWYWEDLRWDVITEEKLSSDDSFNAKYATYLVKNILTRREKDWYDISKNPWVVWTLYNMWNDKNKKPNWDPKIWWSIININWNKYTYWWISMWLYRYLKIYK